MQFFVVNIIYGRKYWFGSIDEQFAFYERLPDKDNWRLG